MKGFLYSLATVILLAGTRVQGQITNLSDAEIQGRALVQKILQQWPSENYTNTGVLNIKDAHGHRSQVPLTVKALASPASWTSVYESGLTTFTAIHLPDGTTTYQLHAENGKETTLSGNQLMLPFVGSDFYLGDLGLEFFHWPRQKILRR